MWFKSFLEYGVFATGSGLRAFGWRGVGVRLKSFGVVLVVGAYVGKRRLFAFVSKDFVVFLVVDDVQYKINNFHFIRLNGVNQAPKI